MRVLVTGATGWVGSAVVKELIAAGHEPTGLARSDANAAALHAEGVAVHFGSLEDPGSVVAGAEAADAVVHTAFSHDFSKMAENAQVERRVIEALGAALAGTGKPLIITSGTALLSPGQVATEAGTKAPMPGDFPRAFLEQTVAAIAERGALTSVVRLPPTVHGVGDHGFVHLLVSVARQKGVAAYVGDGTNRWPAVHRLDAAPVYVLALEKAASGARYHAVAETGVPFRDIAAAIGRGLGLPVVSLSPEQAADHFGWFARFAGLDAPASGEWTSATLGWTPKHPELLADLAGASYFRL